MGIYYSTIASNHAIANQYGSGGSGGGISSEGALTLANSSVLGNRAEGEGGGLATGGGTLNVVDSTLASNRSSASGGGMALDGQSATITNVTLAHNEGPGADGLHLEDSDPHPVPHVQNGSIRVGHLMASAGIQAPRTRSAGLRPAFP